jgi:hypothetical protein
MKRARSFWVPVILGLLAASGVSAASKRIVEMQVTLPNGAAPVMKVDEGVPATVGLKEGKFGFVPTFRAGNESTVVVEVFDVQANPHRQLGQVEVPVGGNAVQSETTPAFRIRVSRVIAGK